MHWLKEPYRQGVITELEQILEQDPKNSAPTIQMLLEGHFLFTTGLRWLLMQEKAELKTEIGQLCIEANEINKRFKILYDRMIEAGLFKKPSQVKQSQSFSFVVLLCD